MLAEVDSNKHFVGRSTILANSNISVEHKIFIENLPLLTGYGPNTFLLQHDRLQFKVKKMFSSLFSEAHFFYMMEKVDCLMSINVNGYHKVFITIMLLQLC